MRNMKCKKVLACLCTIALLLNMIVLPGGAVTTEGNTLTFSDFGMDDMTHVKDGYTGSLPTGTSLDGKTFEGYFTMGFKNGNAYHSVRIGTKDSDAFSGIGIRARDAQTWEIRNYSGNSGGTSLVENLVVADYGITCENGSFSEVKLTMSWDYVKGTKDVKVVIKLNDKECFNGTVANLQNNIGTKLFVWSYNEVPISIRSVAAALPTFTAKRNLTFTDMQTAAGAFDTRWENGVKVTGAQNGGIHPNITTGADLDGVAFSGTIALGKPATGSQYLRYQSLRVGGSTQTNGIGFTPIVNGVIRLYHYSKEDGGIVLKQFNAADYGITYDETNGYGAFDFRITYQNIPDTTNTWVTVTVNDKACYAGVIVNGQKVLGNRAWLFAYTSPITITSAITENEPGDEPDDDKPDVGGEDQDVVVTTFEKLTFSDFGIDDMTHVKDAYTGSLPEVTSLNGKMFEGYITMGFMGSAYHSVRIGTKVLTGTEANGGIGIRAHSTTQWQIRNYNVASNPYNGTDLVERFDIADYGITYDEQTGLFSEVKLSISWDYVEGTKDIKVVIKLNDKECFNGRVAGLQNNIGNKIYIWSWQEVPISVRSVAEKPTLGKIQNMTFEDLGFEDGTKDPTHQKGGTFLNVTTGADLDGVVFNGKVAMGKPATGSQPMRYQSIRIGGSTVTNGIGFTPVANGNIYLYHYSAENKGIVLKVIKAADYGITYDETNGYGAFDFSITYQNIPDTTNTWVTVTVNGKACYEGVIANGQALLGNRAWVFAYTSPIAITSIAIYQKVDFTEFGFTDNWAVELGLKK